jgi:hypothetical protein
MPYVNTPGDAEFFGQLRSNAKSYEVRSCFESLADFFG